MKIYIENHVESIKAASPKGSDKLNDMCRYIASTGNYANGGKACYQATTDELKALKTLCKSGKVHAALALAYDYGRAKGYREAQHISSYFLPL